ncbi:MFS transporter [Thalassospira sp.]|uniref:MFS transporter n=1 Tax=Thalassospira sp. TaxID=1912094 RepID=UPI002732F7DD|nr:MFS transporter [Thalassospira sp.]MDP2699446.1 MFS transporter [Thalassospira sp.]
MPRSPVAILIALSATLFATFTLNSGASLQSSLLALRASAEDFAPFHTGLIMASYYIGFIGGIVWGGNLVNRVGHIRTFAALASIGSAISLLHAVFIDPLTWAIFRAFTGLCLSGLYLVVESWLNEQVDNNSRGGMMAVYMTASLGGLAIGQLLLNLSPVTGFELFTLASVLLSLSLVPIALSRQPPPAAVKTVRMKFRRLYKISPLGFVGAVCSGILTGSVYALGPVFAAMLDLPTADIATFMFFIIFGGMLCQWPIGRLSDRVPRQYVMIAVLGGLAVTCLIPMVMPQIVHDNVIAWGALVGIFVMPVYALSVAYVNDYLSAEDFVPASAALLIVYGAGAAVGPVVGSLALGHFGAWGLPGMFAIVALATGTFAMYRAGFGRRISIEEQGQFVAVPRTTPMAYEMAPTTDAPNDGTPTPPDDSAPSPPPPTQNPGGTANAA